MDLQKIVREREAAAAAKKAAEEKAAAELKSTEADKHRIHTEELKKLLSTVVKEVLEAGARQLYEAGYRCEVTESLSTDGYQKAKKVSLEIELYVEGKRRLPPDGALSAYALVYEGDIDAFTVSVLAHLNALSIRPLGGRGIAVSTVSKAMVEEHLEWFVSEVMKLELP